MRLLWLLDSLRIGGAESLALAFARQYDRSRYELIVGQLQSVPGSSLEQPLRDAGVRVELFGARSLRDWHAFRRLLRFVRNEQIDLIHAHLTYSSIWAALASRFTGVPALASLHVAPPRGTRRALRDRIMRFAVSRWARTVITVSDALRDDYLSGGGIDPAKVRTVHNGIDGTRFARDRATARARLVRDLGLPPGAPIVLTVCVLRDRKGVDVLLAAARTVLQRVPDARFVIAGDGEMGQRWRQLARDLGVEGAVSWAGYRSDVDAFLAGADLFVLPTLEDAFPTVLMEAMWASVPVVASNVGGVPEIVEPGLTGMLVPPGDADRLADAIALLLNDGETRQAMGRRGHDSAARRFSTAAWIARLEEVYRQ